MEGRIAKEGWQPEAGPPNPPTLAALRAALDRELARLEWAVQERCSAAVRGACGQIPDLFRTWLMRFEKENQANEQ